MKCGGRYVSVGLTIFDTMRHGIKWGSGSGLKTLWDGAE